MASEIKVDTISEKTSAGGVTIDGLLIKDGGISGDVSLIGTTPTFTIGDAGAEDAALVFDGNAQDYYIALDDSADDLLIGLGSTVGTTPAISIDENLAIKTYGDITMTGTTPVLTIGDAGAEDTAIVFDGNAQDFYVGLDDSADDLVIGLGSSVGTTPAISINSDRDVTISDGAIDFDVASHDGSNGLKLAGTLVTATAAEMNLLDGGTSVGSSITLADADGFIVNDGGTMKTIPASDISTYAGGGLSAGGQWRLAVGLTGGASPISSNWEIPDTDGYGSLGSTVSQSSGIFTFPSTGYWWIHFTITLDDENNAVRLYSGQIETTTDNSTYDEAARASVALQSLTKTAQSSSCNFLFDVTNTTTHKVRFMAVDHVSESPFFYGDTGKNFGAYVTFLKLGDT